uniref:Uncharacterized protein n=1 Tax=Cacopsylla melanoneura TaxID=428564 RepID=A0A8D9BTU4_9HEMI
MIISEVVAGCSLCIRFFPHVQGQFPTEDALSLKLCFFRFECVPLPGNNSRTRPLQSRCSYRRTQPPNVFTEDVLSLKSRGIRWQPLPSISIWPPRFRVSR